MSKQAKNIRWIETYSGERFDYVNPTLDSINILDIAHSLSMLCRYNGHCHTFYSVAEHSYWVAQAMRKETYGLDLVKAALLHDAVEAYIGDYPSPFKSFIPGIKAFEKKLHVLIMEKFGVLKEVYNHKLILELDSRIIVNERRDIMHKSGHDWKLDKLEPLEKINIEGWSPTNACSKFLTMWDFVEGKKS